MDWEEIPTFDLERIQDVWMHMSSLGLVLSCPQCGGSHEFIQQTFCGLAFGLVKCPHCGDLSKVTPETFERILNRWLVELDQKEAIAVNQSVTQVIEGWHQDDAWKDLLTYRGTNLGEPTERELACYVNSHFCTREAKEIRGG